ncbi:MAG: hypothetical protein AB7O96_09185 [Pseudobdellovibrionaceae bacterium]
MKNTVLSKIIHIGILSLGLFASVVSFEAQACRMSKDPKYNYFINLDSGKISMFGAGENKTMSPTVIDRCQTSGGQHLMLTLGMVRPDLMSDVPDIALDGKLIPDSCQISNSLLGSTQSFEEKKEYFDHQFKLLKTCTYFEIVELDGRPVNFKSEQTQCKMSIKEGVIWAEGNFCFLPIQPAFRFSVATIIKPDCANPDFLRAHNLNPMDVEARLNAYVTGDDSGRSPEVEVLGSSKVRLSISPLKSAGIPLSDDQEGHWPQFPTDFTAEVHMGFIKLRPGGESRVTADLALLVDTRTKKICKDGFCTSAGDYNMPVVAQVELYELKGRKREFVNEWGFAGIARGRWQGLLRNVETKNLDDVSFAKGQKYELVMTFIDPYDDYIMYEKKVEQLLIDLRSVEGGTAGLDVIEPIAALTGLTGIPILTGMPGLTGANVDLEAEVERILRALRALSQERQWPPYYSRVCDSKISTCMNPAKAKFHLKLTTTFELGNVREEDNLFELRNVKVTRESKVGGSYSKSIPALPNRKCDFDQ